VWVQTVLLWLAYAQGTGFVKYDLKCSNPEEMGCKIATSVVSWIIIFLQLACIGLAWVSMASLGNSNHPTETVFWKVFTTVQLMVSIAVVILATNLSYFYEVKTFLFDTTKGNRLFEPAYLTAFIGGIVIMMFQLARLIGIYFPVGILESGDMGIKERRTKKAASSKVETMVEHALYLHQRPPEFMPMRASCVSETVKSLSSSLHASRRASSSPLNTKQSTISEALLNFHRMQDAVEVQGGVVWSMRQFWNGTLHLKEGIYLHGRLLAVNCVQYFVVAFMVALYFMVMSQMEEILSEHDDGCIYTLGKDGDFPSFDPDWNRQVKKRVSPILFCFGAVFLTHPACETATLMALKIIGTSTQPITLYPDWKFTKLRDNFPKFGKLAMSATQRCCFCCPIIKQRLRFALKTTLSTPLFRGSTITT
jgi:hypothetical protein